MPAWQEQVSLWLLLGGGIVAIAVSNHIVEKHNTSDSQSSWFARWAGIVAAMDISAFIAVVLNRLTQTVEIEEAAVPIRDKLSGVSYVILTVVFLILIGGLGWCFYRALAAAGSSGEEQSPDEVGDEGQPQLTD